MWSETLNGPRAVFVSAEKRQCLWTPEHGTVELRGHDDSVLSMAWSPDGMRLASASIDHTVCIWDASSGQILDYFSGHTRGVDRVSWSSDGTKVITSSRRVYVDRPWKKDISPTVHLWDVKTRTQISTIQGVFGPSNRVLASPADGEYAFVDRDGEFYVYSVENAARRRVSGPTDHSDRISVAEWSPDGRLVATFYDEEMECYLHVEDACAVCIRDARTGRVVRRLLRDDTDLTFDYVSCMSWSPCGRFLATGISDGGANVWDVTSGQCLASLGESAERDFDDYDPSDITWSADSGLVVASTRCGRVVVFDVGRGMREIASTLCRVLPYMPRTLAFMLASYAAFSLPTKVAF